jgi:hypothetical protein
MSAARLHVRILASVIILAPVVVCVQEGTAANPPSPNVASPDGAVVTNAIIAAPVPASPPAVAVVPAQLTITVPRPAAVVIPSATALPPASSETIPPVRAMPLNVPTTQELLTKSITSAPGRSQDKLNAIAPSPLSLSITNEAAPVVGAATVFSSSTNTPANQPAQWQKKNPLLNGVDYHW